MSNTANNNKTNKSTSKGLTYVNRLLAHYAPLLTLFGSIALGVVYAYHEWHSAVARIHQNESKIMRLVELHLEIKNLLISNRAYTIKEIDDKISEINKHNEQERNAAKTLHMQLWHSQVQQRILSGEVGVFYTLDLEEESSRQKYPPYGNP